MRLERFYSKDYDQPNLKELIGCQFIFGVLLIAFRKEKKICIILYCDIKTKNDTNELEPIACMEFALYYIILYFTFKWLETSPPI